MTRAPACPCLVAEFRRRRSRVGVAGLTSGAVLLIPVVSRVPVLLGLAVMAALLAACAEPPTLRLSVHRSVLLDEYANPPLWVWTVDAVARTAAVEASLDGAPYRPLHRSARSFRPARPLAPGPHRLTIRVTTAGAFSSTVAASAVARVAALPGRPPVPDDPCYRAGADLLQCGGANAGQWSLQQIRLPELWQALAAGVLRDPEPVVVAVLDTGYVRHPDVVGNLDAAAGYDFIHDPNAADDGDGIDPDATDPGTDGSWHGTAIAGVIAAHTDNGIGVAGIGWPWSRSRVTIMPVRVAGAHGATTYDVAQGLLYAAGLENDSGVRPARPAKIINLSLAEALLGPPDEVLEDALRRVTAAGAIVVAAAGNHDSAVRAPANSTYTVAVGSVTANQSLAFRSNFGPEIDVVAPGGDHSAEIPTLGVDRRAGVASPIVRADHGTSIAAAHVSGVLALLAGFDGSITLSDVRAILSDAAADLGTPGRDDRFGPGLLDAFSVFGVYSGRRSVQVDRFSGGRVGSAAQGGAAPGSADPHSLIVRFRAAAGIPSAAAAASERMRARHAVADVEVGAGGYTLVRLNEGQDRERIKEQLQADAAVAAVYENRIYRPAVVLVE